MTARTLRTVRLARARHVVPVLRIDAAIHPSTAGSGTVILEVLILCHLLPVGNRVAVDLPQDRCGFRLMPLTALGICPCQVLDGPILRIRAVGVKLLQPFA